MTRRLVIVALIAVIALVAVTIRAVSEGERAMAESDAAFNRGDLREAIDRARAAATLYAPGVPHVGAAYGRLAAVALGAEGEGRLDVAATAWRAARGAALETRHLWIPRAAELDRANANLARLGASGTSGSRELRERAVRALARDDAPRAPWIAVLGAGLASTVAGLLLLALRGVTPAGRWVPGRARLPVLLTLAGVACWTIAVYQA